MAGSNADTPAPDVIAVSAAPAANTLAVDTGPVSARASQTPQDSVPSLNPGAAAPSPTGTDAGRGADLATRGADLASVPAAGGDIAPKLALGAAWNADRLARLRALSLTEQQLAQIAAHPELTGTQADKLLDALEKGPQPAAQAPAEAASWTDDIRKTFTDLGLDKTTVATIEQQGLSRDQLVAFYGQLASQKQAGKPLDLDAALAAAKSGPLADSTPVPTGPPAWNEQWRQRFVAAGAPDEFVNKLMMSGAGGADEAMLTSELADVSKQIDQTVDAVRKKFPEQMKTLDEKGFTKVEIAHAALAAAQQPLPKVEEFLEGLAATKNAHGFIRGSTIDQLPWFFVPGYKLYCSIAGYDPFAGTPVHHHVDSYMDNMMALGGATGLVQAIRGGITAHQGVNLINESFAPGGNALIRQMAEQRGMTGPLKGVAALWAHVPWTPSNKMVTGAAQFSEKMLDAGASLHGTPKLAFDAAVKGFADGSVRFSASTLGMPAAPFGLGHDIRGAMMNRKVPLHSWKVASDGALEVHMNPWLGSSDAGAAKMAEIGSYLLDSKTLGLKPEEAVASQVSAGLMSRMQGAGKVLDPNSALAKAQKSVFGEAAEQLHANGKLKDLNAMQKLWQTVRPGPVRDALEAVKLRAIHAQNGELLSAIDGARNAVATAGKADVGARAKELSALEGQLASLERGAKFTKTAVITSQVLHSRGLKMGLWGLAATAVAGVLYLYLRPSPAAAAAPDGAAPDGAAPASPAPAAA